MRLHRIFKISKTYQEGTLKPLRFFFSKINQKKHVEVTSLFHPSKLYRQCTLRGR